MKKSIAMLLAMVMTMSLAFTGCGKSKDSDTSNTDQSNQTDQMDQSDTSTDVKGTKSEKLKGNVLLWNLGADSKTLDPTLNSTVDGGHIINNTFEGLYRDKNDGQGSQPAMASTEPTIKENEDGTVTYTFTLRDAKWSDGQAVKAQDFVYSWQRAADPVTASEYSYIMNPILNYADVASGKSAPDQLGVKALDEKTLEVTLIQPTGYFLELLGFPTYMPLREDIVGTDTSGLWAKDPAKSISNGPFTLSGYSIGKEFVLSKNENYWNASAVKIDHIVAKMIIDQSTSLTAFNSDEIYIVENIVPDEEISQLSASGKLQILPYIATRFYVINTQSNNEALKKLEVRKALSMAIDRKSLVDNVTRAGEKPALGLVPYGFTDSEGKDFRETAGSSYLTETAQLDEAKKLLESAGYPNGEGIDSVEIIYNTSESNKAVAEAVQQMWSQLGITATLSNQEWAVFQDTRQNLSYSGVARHSWVGDYLDPQTFLDMFITGNTQSSNGYTNTEFDKQMETALKATGKERYDAFYAAEKILMEDAYIIPLYFQVNKVLVNEDKLQGWSMSPTGKLWFGDAELM